MTEPEVVWHGARWRDLDERRHAPAPTPAPPRRVGESATERVFGALTGEWASAPVISERVGRALTTVRPILVRLADEGRIERLRRGHDPTSSGLGPREYGYRLPVGGARR